MAPLDANQLPDVLAERVKEVVLRRINQAREALELPSYQSLEQSEPNSSCDCLLGHHLNVWAYKVHVHCKTREEAEKIAAAWGTSFPSMTSTGEDLHAVTLPRDLQVATAAFDAGQLPDLITDDVPQFSDDYGDPQPADAIASALGA